MQSLTLLVSREERYHSGMEGDQMLLNIPFCKECVEASGEMAAMLWLSCERAFYDIVAIFKRYRCFLHCSESIVRGWDANGLKKSRASDI